MHIILASASPRRRELLAQIGLAFEVRVSRVEEKVTQTDAPLMVEELSAQKAEAVMELAAPFGERAAPTMPGNAKDAVLVIGADTVVAVEGHILGKPSGAEEAAKMLSMLSGHTHEVYTGVTLLFKTAEGIQRKTFHERTKVIFYPMSEREIAAYISTGDCMDKAGAYGIQGFCARYIKGIEGDYNNVVGLPVGRLYQEVREWLEQ